MYKVLWIDDELARHQSEMNVYAKKYRCQLEAFETRDEGMEYFIKYFREIDAIILDGLFVVSSVDGEDIKEKALNLCLEEITRLEERENTYFPRVIYTGQQKILGDSDFEDNRGIKVFEKVDDPLDLFKYIKEQIELRKESHLRKLYCDFSDVCDSNIYEGAELWTKFLPALEAVHENKSGDTSARVGALRRILDRISKTMADYGMIPGDLTNGSASLTLVSIFLNGRTADLRREGTRYQMDDLILPSLFLSAFRFILDATGVANHEEWEKDVKLKDHSIIEYEELIPNNQLLKTATFVAMDLVIGVHQFIADNPDPLENCKNWREMTEKSSYQKSEQIGEITKLGNVIAIIGSGAGFFQPDGSTDSNENGYIPKEFIEYNSIERGARLKVEMKVTPAGKYEVTNIIDVLG